MSNLEILERIQQLEQQVAAFIGSDCPVLIGRVSVPRGDSNGVVIRSRSEQPSGEREWRQWIEFHNGYRYKKPPQVEVAISFIDANTERYVRVKACARDISQTGFNLVAGSWNNSVLYGLELLWIATPGRVGR